MMSKIFLSFLFIAAANGDALLQGEFCGVIGTDFLSPNFTGSVAVAGDGCASENNTNCLCAPDFNDKQKLSSFLWQCNGSVEFGPKNATKMCPLTVPVIKKVGIGEVDFSEESLAAGSPCNTSIHPTGRPGDESCGYSECETGGKYSAICACVDLGNRSEVQATGMQWICLHSTCGCSLPDATSSASMNTPFIFVALASCVAYFLAGL